MPVKSLFLKLPIAHSPYYRDAETPYVFELTVADRTFFFCASDEDTVKEWMDAIKRSKNEWWKTEQERKGKTLARKPLSSRDSAVQGSRIKLNEVEFAKVRELALGQQRIKRTKLTLLF